MPAPTRPTPLADAGRISVARRAAKTRLAKVILPSQGLNLLNFRPSSYAIALTSTRAVLRISISFRN